VVEKMAPGRINTVCPPVAAAVSINTECSHRAAAVRTNTVCPPAAAPHQAVSSVGWAEGETASANTRPLGVQASPLEVVVAHYKENLGWLVQLAENPHIGVYTKGSEPVDGLDADAEVHQLPNVGREAHSYLSHIGDEKLADWFVFTQAGEPSFGYRGASGSWWSPRHSRQVCRLPHS
jgi:hypothetical protein